MIDSVDRMNSCSSENESVSQRCSRIYILHVSCSSDITSMVQEYENVQGDIGGWLLKLMS